MQNFDSRLVDLITDIIFTFGELKVDIDPKSY